MTADAVFPPRCSHVPVKASEFSYEDASSALPPAVSPSSHPSPQVSAGPGHGGHFPEVTTSRPKPQGRHAYVTQRPLEGRGTARLHTLHGGSSFQKLPSCGSLLPCPAAALLLSAWLLPRGHLCPNFTVYSVPFASLQIQTATHTQPEGGS